MPTSINLPSDGTLVTQTRKWTDAMWAWMRDLTASFNSGGGFAPADATYFLRTADTDLTNARVGTDSATVTLDYATPGQVKWTAVNTGTVTHTGTLTAGQLIQGNGGADITVNATTATVTKLTAGVPSAATAGTDYTNLAYKTIAVSGQSDVVADSAADTLTLVAGTNVTITTDAGTDSITINATATSTDHVVMSDGSQPPLAMDDGNGNFLYVDYTP